LSDDKIVLTEVAVGVDEVTVVIEARPVSLQGSATDRARLTRTIRAAIADAPRLFLGDTRVEIEWMVHEDERYLGVQSPDVDNIAKPILDALSGPTGLLVNDCQVQSVTVFWIDGPPALRGYHRLTIRVRSLATDLVNSRDVYWVRCDDGLCFPLWHHLPGRVAQEVITYWLAALARFEELVKGGMDRSDARLTLPLSPRFHHARLGGFQVMTVAEARNQPS
jgi:hypothetical protein